MSTTWPALSSFCDVAALRCHLHLPGSMCYTTAFLSRHERERRKTTQLEFLVNCEISQRLSRTITHRQTPHTRSVHPLLASLQLTSVQLVQYIVCLRQTNTNGPAVKLAPIMQCEMLLYILTANPKIQNA